MRTTREGAGPVLVAPAALAVLLVLVGALALALAYGLPGTGASRAAAQPASVEVTPQTDDSVPAPRVTMIGASPLEAPGETWGVGRSGEGAGVSSTLVRYTSETGWSLGGALENSAGQALSGFKLDEPQSFRSLGPSPLAGQMTAEGVGVMVGTVPGESGGTSQVVLLRNPGGSFQETTTVPTEDLTSEESLFGARRAPLIAPLEEAGHAGALIVPVNEQGSGVEEGVLHWDGSHWSREQIEIPEKSKTDFRVLAIGASSLTNAWLLAQLSSSYPPGAVALFRRHSGVGGEAPSWRPVAPKPGGEPGEPLTVEVPKTGVPGELESKPFTVPGTGEPPTVQTQILTVTSEGVWIDGERQDVGASATMFFKPEGESTSGRVVTSWCKLPENAPAGTPPCQHELPESLPSGPSRSIAWANPATTEGLGERVIAGLANGVSLRLEGNEFKRVLALGGSEPPRDVGGTYGAAFSNPREGWLGNFQLPVHLTLNPIPSRLQPWPVSFRHALVAIAPQPGAPIGSTSSEALAVGDQGEVARYKPGEGWLPESLFTSGGRLATPRLRSLAWPTPKRAYAVGDLGQMWLWRGETGLWEPDPATPINFRGNLLGIAFDPSNPARGYAVGSSSTAGTGGVLLRYGKNWTQEPEEAIPAAARGASFTSIAFAGSEAIVAYRKLPDRSVNRYVGGLIVNNGSGWQIDEGAAAAIGSNVPWAVAGLPDGGAAFTASGSVYEREGSAAAWQPTPTPFPGGGEAGSLALFREGGALRVIASGSVPNTYAVESETTPPPGSPPNLIGPYPLGENAERGVVRQTTGGWSDEEHELNDVREPPGSYSFYDTVFQPDPVATVLIDPTGTQGWAVGGFVDTINSTGVLDTADVDRYPAGASPPPGVGISPIPAHSGQATFAIGGNAQCAAPCADRAKTQIGPDAWLQAALARTGQIPGVRAFLYTGPHLTTGETAGPATLPIPYARELYRYAQLLETSPIPTFAAATPTDLDIPRNEELFQGAFAGFPEPFGTIPAAQGSPLQPAPGTLPSCSVATAGCQHAYYAMNSAGSGGEVRVIVLDDSTDVDSTQQEWLQAQLQEAQHDSEPAIVIGNADLNAQIAAGDATAAAVAQILVTGRASAYFYDSPEKNIAVPLRVGSESIPTFGSGTLGYVNFQAESSGDFLGASGFLLAEVNTKAREPSGRFPVTARLIPNIGELALEAKGGTLLPRSQTGLFAALARRPRAGNQARNLSTRRSTDPYIPIPSSCIGTACANGLFPEYTFTSEHPDYGGFVVENLASVDPHKTPLQNAKGEPVPDEPRNAKGELTPNRQFEENKKGEPINEKGEVVPRAQSGLFCAYNKGTTTVTISAGGLSSSLPVTVQAGSVRQPCGTTKLKELPKSQQQAPVPPPPAPAPAGPAPASAPPPVPLPPPPAAIPPSVPARHVSRPPSPRPFFLPPLLPVAAIGFVPPPPPPAANPTPPSGTSAVTSPIQAAQREEEDEEAPESVSAKAVAYRSSEHEPAPGYILGILLLAAFAGASVRRRPRRGRRDVRVAPATITTSRSQQRMDHRNRNRQ